VKAKTFPDEMRRIRLLLRETFRQAGHGSMARTARSLGLRPKFFSGSRKRLDVGLLIHSLRELGVSPADFFAELEGRGVPLGERSTEETHRAVRMAYRRMRAELPGVDLVAELEGGGDGDEIPAAVGALLGAEWLAGLDGRRQDAPEVIAGEIAANLHQLEPALLPRALGVWCSALRLVLELEVAADLNSWALRLAKAAGDSATVADLYIRRGYVVADAGNHLQALTLAELATGIFARLDDQAGMGRALVSCGRWLHYLGRIPEAIQAAKHALELPLESPSRVATLQGLGLVYLARGQLDEAEQYAELAEPFATSADHRAKILWLRASICRKNGRLDESAELFRQVVDAFQGSHFGEAALAAVELVRVLLEQGKPGEARKVCRSLFPLLGPLEPNPIISAAFGELLQAGAFGSLSLDLVKRVKAKLEEARRDVKARRQWRALTVAS
jgi:tetratricopeptide (TPR) repeat protein